MSSAGSLTTRPARVHWDDLEAFGIIAQGIAAGKNLQQIAEDPSASMKGPRMLYLRLSRLERALGKRLVDRRPWGRTAQLTGVGRAVARVVAELSEVRRRVLAAAAGEQIPVLRVVTHATLASALIPPAVRRRRGKGDQGFHLELMVVAAYADAVAAVNDDRADVGLYLAFPRFDRVPTPRTIRREILGSSKVVLLVSARHPLAARAGGRPKPVTLDDLAGQTIITRGYVDLQIFPPSFPAWRIVVPHSLDKLTYVQRGIGVALLPKFIADLQPRRRGVVELPFRPLLQPELCLLRPRKNLRPLSDAAELFVEELKRSCRSALQRSSAG